MDITPDDEQDRGSGQQMGEGGPVSEQVSHSGMDRRRFLTGTGLMTGGVLIGSALGIPSAAAAPLHEGSAGEAQPAAAPLVAASRRPARRKTLFGIGYETWFLPGINEWGSAEATPVLGHYNSMDENVIVQHAKWLSDAGLDFILIDWSNNLGGSWTNGVAQKIIGATMKLMEVYTKLHRHPKFGLLLGTDGGAVNTANFDAQIQLIYSKILDVPDYAAMWQQFKGKPLLGIYRGPQFESPPVYTNDKFTVRILSAYHETTLNPWGDWSWLDRKPLTNGPMDLIAPFAASSLGAWKGAANWSALPADQFSHLPFATTQPANGASGGSLASPAFTVSQRTITFNAAGADLLATEHTDWSLGDKLPSRNVFLLRDAHSGLVLRHDEPPGLITNGGNSVVPTGTLTGSTWRMRQWDVSDLQGRSVFFQAVNNFTGPPFNWIAVSGLALTTAEQMVAAVGNEGAPAPGWTGDWDTQRRNAGATLMQYMRGVFHQEPEVALVQQWNEFGPPDQYSVEESNDIEPTVITRFEGAESDGWGTYYLDLVTRLIKEYRNGLLVPQVKLDSSYP